MGNRGGALGREGEGTLGREGEGDIGEGGEGDIYYPQILCNSL